MTALHQYSRLEAAGLWRSAQGAQRREVIVGLRKATLVLLDPKSEIPLAQWSLPAIVRLSSENGAVIFASHEDGDETLEIDDAVMIAALDKVRDALDRRRKKPGRLRLVFSATGLALAVGMAGIWVPLRLYDFTALRLPDAVRRDIAAMAMRDIASISGSPCAGTMGVAAAADLVRRITPPTALDAAGNARPVIAVLREGITAPASLPDGTVLLPFSLVERADGPDSLAGVVLAARLQAAQTDPLIAALRHAGIFATFRLLSTGALPQNALQGYGLALASASPAPMDAAALHAAFSALQITAAPYANFVANPDLAALPETAPKGSDPIVLDDAAFLGLQYICDS